VLHIKWDTCVIRIGKYRRLKWCQGKQKLSNVTVEKPLRKRLLGRSKRQWKNCIKMALLEVSEGEVN